MKRNFDVAVIGAGPAGATLAYELARKGIEVLLLDKEKFPRYKCCAGGISARAAKLLDYDISSVVEDRTHDVKFAYHSARPWVGHDHQVLLHTVMRDKFDSFLVNRAERAGVIFIDRQKVTDVGMSADGVKVSTADNAFLARFVAGADGVCSWVAKRLGIKRSTNYVVAMGAELVGLPEDVARWSGQARIDLGYVGGGYAWVFPKSDHISVGVGCSASRAKGLRQAYASYIRSLHIDHYSTARCGSWLIPIWRGDSALWRSRALLLGDAAGLVDPLTGEGIYHALLSAHLAASVLEDCLMCGKESLDEYQRVVEEQILSEMDAARTLSGVLAFFPWLAFGLLKRDARVWGAARSLFHGTTEYASIAKATIDRRGKLRLIIRALGWLSRLKGR
jgi:geranylgeranyl reductase family protein